MKSIRIGIAMALAWAAIIAVNAATWTDDAGYTWSYNISGSAATITGVSPAKGEIAIPSVIAGCSVTSIGDWAFSRCSGLASVTIPDSVTSIGDHAFFQCSGLTSVTIPDSVTSIEDYAFYLCSGLTSVTIPDSVTSIGPGAFSDCNDSLFDTTTIPGVKLVDGWAVGNTGSLSGNLNLTGIRGIGPYAFSRCSGLASVTIPDSVTSIGSSAFEGCSGLTSIIIPAAVTNIGHAAFYGCGGLTSVTIPNSVTSIGESAFSRCRGLTSVTIPDSVTNIGWGAFEYCSGLTSVTIPDSVTSIGSSAFWCSGLTSVTIPDSVTSIGANAFYGCSGLTSVTIPDSVTSIGYQAFSGCSGLTSVTIPSSVTSIEARAFSDCNCLRVVMLPRSFNGNLNNEEFPSAAMLVRYAAEQTIALNANGGDISIASLNRNYGEPYGELPLPCRIGYKFNGWVLDEELVDSSTVVSALDDHTLIAQWTVNEYEVTFDAAGGVIDGTGGVVVASRSTTFDSTYGELPTASCEGYVFLGWTLGGADVTAETIVKTAENHTLMAKWGIHIGNGIWSAPICDEPITLGAPLVPPSGEVVIPAAIAGRPVVGIEAGSFAGNASITSVTIPSSVMNVAAGAFAGISCPFTAAVETLVGMHENEFGECPLTVVVSDDAQRIPEIVKANVRKVVFADGVTRIGDSYFTGCPYLETFDIAESVVRIGTNVFEAASALETVVSNGFVLYQGWCLGSDNGEGAVVTQIPEGVRGIAAGAFDGEYGIETVEFPSTLRFISAGAFRDCTGLEDIALPEGVVAVDREAFRNCTYAQSLILPTTLEEIGADAFANATSLAGVTVPDGVVDIGEAAFSNSWRMMSATIPASVTNVGAAAFADCRRLTGVTVPFGLGTMAELFPAAYDKITSVRIADGHAGHEPLPMDAGMFAGCAAMVDLTLPEGLAEIADDAFAGCASMAAFDLPESVTNIGARAFKDLSQLTSFEFPAGLSAVGDEAFSGCSGIPSLTLPEGIRSIGERAFHDLSLLSRVDIPASVSEIGAAAFGGCTRVRAVSLPGDVATVAAILPDTYRQITSAAVVDGHAGRVTLPGDTAVSSKPHYQIIDLLFEGCEALASVEFPASVTGIGARALAGCTSLTDAGIPSGVTSLGEEVFSGCANLSSVSLPKGLAVLSSRMFEGCASLNEVVVPEGVATLGANVFNECSALRTVAYVGNAPSYDAAAYAGVPASLVTKVVNGSTGWDGIATSKALPEFWPSGTSNEITFWEPNRFMVSFDPNDGATAATEVEQITGTTYMLPADAVRRGAVFGGWWTAADGGARVTASTQVVLTRPHVFYAHWTFNRYSVHFDANGGEGEMEPQGMTVDTSANLAECGFSRMGYAFAGWATEPDGEVVYADAAEVTDLAYAQNAAVTLYAVWEERDWTLAEYVDAPNLTLANDATAEWTPDWTTFKVGGVSLRSGAIAAADEGGRSRTTLTTMVFGEGAGSFWWKVSCEEMDADYGEWYDYAVFTIDGAEVAKIAGESGWKQVEYTVSGTGTHTLAWTFTRDDYDEDETAYENAAWVDGVVWTPKPVTVTFDAGGAAGGEVPEAVVKYAGYELTLPGAGTLANGEYQFMGWTDGMETYAVGSTYVFPSANVTLTAVWELKTWTLGEAVDATMLSFTTGGEADWSVDTANGWTNGVSAKSGAVASGESSWAETTVNGAGTLVFRWNVMGGIYRNNPFAYAKVEVDGVQKAQEHKTDGWKEQSVEVEGTGTHTIRWTYLRTSARAADGDCAWLDAVWWTPDAAAEPFPEVATNAAPGTVAAALSGAADAGLVANVVDGTNYNAFREWAARVKGANGAEVVGAQTVKESAKAWLSYALGSDRLIAKEIASNDVHIVRFAVDDGAAAGGIRSPVLAFEVAIDGVNIGGGSVPEVVLKENLKKVLGMEGAASLTPSAFSSDNITITFDTPIDGKAKFTASPPSDVGDSFFMRVKVK